MTYRSNELGVFVFWIVILVALLIVGPLLIIWALNTLFPALAIPYTFWTWLAVVVMNLTWAGKYAIQKD